METQRSNWEISQAAREKGIVAIPCHPGTKVPAVPWKRWQSEMPPPELQERWFRDTRMNISILTTGMVVFDCETAEKAEVVLMHCGETPHMLRSPGGGIHLGYRKRKGVAVQNRVKIKGEPIDIRTDGGLELIPNSVTEKGAYVWLGTGLNRIASLPVARIGWTRTRTRRATKILTSSAVPSDRSDVGPSAPRLLYRGRKYVDTFERAVSGRGGHTATFVAALKIVRFVRLLGGGPEEAWQLLLHFNRTKCDPEWDERSLRHKLEDGLKTAR
jgi:hypothetical protein